MRAWLAIVMALGLSACGVVSEKPLFGPADASRHPLAEGLWAMTSAGCEVSPLPPGQQLLECAVPVTIRAGRMSWDTAGVMQSMLGPMAGAFKALPVPKSSQIVLVDGEPGVLELVNGPTIEMAAPVSPTSSPVQPGYLGLRPLSFDASGRVVRAVFWNIFCPKDPATSGFSTATGKCVVQSPDAIRRQARHMPPLMSFYLTWIRSTP